MDFLDGLVSAGLEPSRAAIVTRSLERERRRRIAGRDAEILAGSDQDADLGALAAYSARRAHDLG